MPRITLKELEKQIKSRTFAPVYVLYGSEQMYVRELTKKLVTAVAGKQPSEFNYHTFSGEVDLDTLAAAAEVVPFMSEYNCVVVTDLFVDAYNADDLEKLRAIFKRKIDGTVLILSMPSYVPKRNKKAFDALVKRAEKDGMVVNFETLNRSDIERYIVKWANANGKLIKQSTVSQLMRVCGNDLNRLKNEVDKLCAFAKGEEVPYEAIDLLVAQNLEASIFTLSTMVLNGRGDDAFLLLDNLFTMREEPAMMLYALATAFTDAYRMRVADESGVSQKTVAADFAYNKRAFALGKARDATRRVSTEALRDCLDALTEADFKMKNVSVNERLLLEQLIAQLLLICGKGRK